LDSRAYKTWFTAAVDSAGQAIIGTRALRGCSSACCVSIAGLAWITVCSVAVEASFARAVDVIAVQRAVAGSGGVGMTGLARHAG
jgi:hypothetical protein